MVKHAKHWPWSSYLDTTGYREAPSWLNTHWLLAAFGKQQGKAMEQYRSFASEGKNQPSPWESLQNQIYLGSESFVQKLQEKIDKGKDLSEIPKSQKRPKPKTLKQYEKQATGRNQAIQLSYASGGYSMKEIGDYYGIHYSCISRIIN